MWGRIRAEWDWSGELSGDVFWFGVTSLNNRSSMLTTKIFSWPLKNLSKWAFFAAADGCHQLGLQMYKVIFLYFSCFRCLNVTIQDHILQYMPLGEQTSLTFYSLIKLLYTQRLFVSVASCSALFSSFSLTVCWAARVETLRLNPSGELQSCSDTSVGFILNLILIKHSITQVYYQKHVQQMYCYVLLLQYHSVGIFWHVSSSWWSSF